MLKKKKNNILFNFISTKKRRNKSPLIFRCIIYFCLLLVIMIAALSIFYYLPAKSFYINAKEGKKNFELTQTYINKEDFSKAHLALVEANNNFEQAQKNLKKMRALKFIPIIGQQYTSLENLVFAGSETGKAVEKITKIVIEITEPFKKDNKISLSQITENDREEILKKIYESVPDLQGAKAEIDLASIAIKQIPKRGLLSPIKNAVKPFQDNLPFIQDLFNKVIPLAQVMPQVAGYPDEQVYLFLLQNNSELRPTGGFIGTYGILKVENGEIKDFWTDNSYNLDDKAVNLNVEPPWPLTRYNKVFQWYFRDSNWSPDFPTSAEKAVWFYKQEGGSEKQINGVIAVTPTFIESLIGLTGDIDVNGTKFTNNNFVDTLQYEVEKGYLMQGIRESERKEVIGELGKILIDRLLKLPQNKWKDLWSTLENDLIEKQILIYLTNNGNEGILVDQGWGGNIKNVDYDYLSIIDANLASLKSDPGVERTIDYQIMKQDNRLKAKVTITYQNKGTFTWKTTRYRSYVRLYAPKGSSLENIQGTQEDQEVEDELEKTSFGTFISIEPSETKSLTFNYWLPDRILEQLNKDEYRLLVQKQPGTLQNKLSISINIGKPIKSYSPIDKGKKEDNNMLKLDTDLSQDRYFLIEFK